MSYCKFIQQTSDTQKSWHQPYHDERYGRYCDDDNQLFAYLMFEINQSGLSWGTILQKEASLKQTYHDFNVLAVAQLTEDDIHRMLANPGIIRHNLKIRAAIFNAQKILILQKEFGSWFNWLKIQLEQNQQDLNLWCKAFKANFKFVGATVIEQFLISAGIWGPAHDDDCPITHQLCTLPVAQQPLWLQLENKKHG